jgi:hypothetical protein
MTVAWAFRMFIICMLKEDDDMGMWRKSEAAEAALVLEGCGGLLCRGLETFKVMNRISNPQRRTE